LVIGAEVVWLRDLVSDPQAAVVVVQLVAVALAAEANATAGPPARARVRTSGRMSLVDRGLIFMVSSFWTY